MRYATCSYNEWVETDTLANFLVAANIRCVNLSYFI